MNSDSEHYTTIGMDVSDRTTKVCVMAKGDLWGLTPLQETVENYLFRRKDLMAILFSRG